MAKRRSFNPEFKAKVVLEILIENKSMAQASREYGIKDSVLSRWKQEFIERSPQVFERGTSRDDRDERIAELERMVGRLAMELEMSKKVKVLMIRPGPVKTNLYNNAVIAPGYDISTLFKFEKRMFITPIEAATPLIKAIKKGKEGILYPNFSTKLLVKLMSSRIIGKGFSKQMAKFMMNKREKEEK